MDVGFWSVIPPLLTIALAIITKEVLMSLFIGVYTGCLIMSDWNPLAAMEEMVGIIIDCLTDPEGVQVIIICVMLGGLIGLLVRSGGAAAFGELLGRKIKTRKGAQGVTWLIGILIFFDDYFNALTNGSVMRPISDKYMVSREKLSYIVDSTSVGICLVVPLSSWVAFICSLISDAFGKAGIEGDSFSYFIQCIPFNYYAWLSLLMVIVVVYLGLDFGPMAKAEKRTMETGVLCDKTFSGGEADEDDFSSIDPQPGKAVDLLAPILLLIVLALTFMLYTGGFFESFSVLEAVNDMNGMLALTYAISLAVVFAIIFYAVKGLSKITDSLASFIVGTKSMLFVVILLTFAWSIGSVSDELGTAEYLVDIMVGSIPGSVLPLLIFAISCIMTFATGASWGTYAIMIPLAVPLAVAMDANVFACITAVLGGGGFGNHCSPLADTAILSSASSNIRHTDHIKTQIPYSVTCATVACFGFIVSGILGPGSSPLIPIVVVAVAFMAALFVLNRLFGANRYSISHIEAESSGDGDSQ
ncbi:MAG: Na+/H+ antiporter NhaC family protein [Clostridiales bacterium]|nr:Na+/H+ antiporter NhaC family protein [Clostridiales bacterium]